MIPRKDENPTRGAPVVTLALIAACVGIYFFVQPAGQATLTRRDAADDARFNLSYAAIPCEVTTGEPQSISEIERTFTPPGDQTACDDPGPGAFPNKNVYAAVLYSMFLHGSLLHLGGNMLFLWIFGNNIEDRRGKVQYLVFYLLAGLAATAAHIAVQPRSSVPVVGASGAIAGVMGAYLVLFPNVRIRSVIFLGFFVFFRDIAAKWLLGFWLLSQFFINPNSGVAWVAHVGGFAFGVLAGLVWRGTTPQRPVAAPPRPYGPYRPYS